MTAQDTAVHLMPFGDYADVLGNVRAEIARRRLSQVSLAAAMGQNQQWLSRRLAGHVALSVPELLALADLIGCDVRELLPAHTVRREGIEPPTRCLEADIVDLFAWKAAN